MLLLPLLAPWADGLTGQLGELHSEYTFDEILSKYAILLMLLVCVCAYSRLRESRQVLLAITAFLFSLALYLGESNMIKDTFQPMYGLVLGVPVTWLLLKSRSWLALLLFGAGLVLIGSGSILDAIADQRIVIGSAAQALVEPFRQFEELLEAAGCGVLFLAMLAHFLGPVTEYAASHGSAAAGVLGGAALVATGNSFLHYAYKPSTWLQAVALATSAVGFATLLWANHRFSRGGTPLGLGTIGLFNAFAFTAFVLLPVVNGRSDAMTSLVFWPIVFIAIGVLLVRHNPG